MLHGGQQQWRHLQQSRRICGGGSSRKSQRRKSGDNTVAIHNNSDSSKGLFRKVLRPRRMSPLLVKAWVHQEAAVRVWGGGE